MRTENSKKVNTARKEKIEPIIEVHNENNHPNVKKKLCKTNHASV